MGYSHRNRGADRSVPIAVVGAPQYIGRKAHRATAGSIGISGSSSVGSMLIRSSTIENRTLCEGHRISAVRRSSSAITDRGRAHPLRGDELRALRELRRQFPDSEYVFATERGGPFTADAVNRLIKRIGARAGMPFQVHAHMLRHGCGYALANAVHDTRAIQDWLGHRSIQHTVRYTELAPTRFKDFWR